VQGELERALRFLDGRREPSTVFAGRTDRGVHAAGQVVSLDDPRPDLATGTVVRALNARLPDDLAVREAWRADDGFHARYDARWREYRYRVWFGGPEPLAARQVWRRTGVPDLVAMRAAASAVVGTHDFASFAGGGEGVPGSVRRSAPRGTVRTMHLSAVERIAPWWGAGAGTLVEYRIVGDGFLPRMVRNLAAALVEIGRGTRPVDWVEELLAAKDRRAGGGTAEPHGLTLWRVGYAAFGESAGATVGEDSSGTGRQPAADTGE